ncbi:hypothetical protein EVAR_40454_1 [Eumeta japonica]|uniref:Uncharacterized protein n=1 Tax=Eumeta variegata TaxID=151549 RepID=A0A4C1WZZ3_EUMVA|nr:hypothetical protein EVAR_40454_1 [Eumeta japonica]
MFSDNYDEQVFMKRAGYFPKGRQRTSGSPGRRCRWATISLVVRNFKLTIRLCEGVLTCERTMIEKSFAQSHTNG